MYELPYREWKNSTAGESLLEVYKRMRLFAIPTPKNPAFNRSSRAKARFARKMSALVSIIYTTIVALKRASTNSIGLPSVTRLSPANNSATGWDDSVINDKGTRVSWFRKRCPPDFPPRSDLRTTLILH